VGFRQALTISEYRYRKLLCLNIQIVSANIKRFGYSPCGRNKRLHICKV